jgi:hypothetical protein
MLDVHPPHAPTHTWRDFLLHIATIVVGLLIAIGLEQTVEFFHHRHQLHQLHQDLHAESLRNLHIALADIDDSEEAHTRDVAIYQEVVVANRDHRAPVLHATLGHSGYVKPASAAWTVAQQSGTLGLLPRDEAQVYVRVYSLVDQSSGVIAQGNAASSKLRDALAPGVAVLSPDQQTLDPAARDSATWAALDAEDFRDARNALAQLNDAYAYGANRSVLVYGIEWSVLHGSRSDEENLNTMFDAANIYRKGGKAALLARYPLPKDDTTASTTPEQ